VGGLSLDGENLYTKQMQCKLEANEDKEFHLAWEIVLMYCQILKTDINRNI